MKVPLSWLSDFVDIDVSIQELADKLTMVGLEVTSLDKIGDDHVFDIEVTPNRPDCLSIVGVAREVAVLLNKRFKPPKMSFLPKTSAAYIRENEFEIIIEDKEACPRYIGRILLEVEVKDSPDFIKERLEKVGLRSINNIVDITNYVLIELGQPMHAFDYDKLEGKKIIVRFAKEGERIKTIDGVERQLSKEDLVIADSKHPVALAGIMGGKETEVSQFTKNILLESAYFNPLIIRRSSQRHALTTESSYRFERGVDFITVDNASKYAVELIRKYASRDTRRTTVLIDKSIDLIKKQVPLSSKVMLRYSEIERILGVMPSAFWIRKLLRNLGVEILSISKDGLKVQAPSYRRDLKEEIDYIEEIARFYGYEEIPEKGLPQIMVQNEEELKKFGEKEFEDEMRGELVKKGLKEVITYTFLSEEEVEKFKIEGFVPLSNPLSRNYAVLRTTIIPSLLRVAQYNFNHNVYDLAIFELGKIYLYEGEPKEVKVLGILLSGLKYKDYFGEEVNYTFYDLKGIIEDLLGHFGISDFKIQEGEDLFFASSCSAKLYLGNELMAKLGKVSQGVSQFYDLGKEIFVAEIYLEPIKRHKKEQIRYKPIPQYPFIIRDISVLVPKGLSYAQIIEKIEGKSPLIKEISLIDVYEGERIPPDKRSLTIRIKYQSEERTLRDEEVDEIDRMVRRTLTQELPCQLR